MTKIYNYFREPLIARAYSYQKLSPPEDLVHDTFKEFMKTYVELPFLKLGDKSMDLSKGIELKAESQDGKILFSTLSTILKRLVFKLLKQRKRMHVHSFNDYCEKISANPVVNEFDSHDSIRKLLAHLKEKDQEILILRHVMNHSYDEIASIVEIEKKTVQSRLKRIMKRLRTIYPEKTKIAAL